MTLKKIEAGAALAGVLSATALGFGAGLAQAKPHRGPPIPPIPVIPGNVDWVPGLDPPGHNPFGPPGQVMQGNPVVPGLTGVPPGHWGETWLPPNWLDLGIPGPLPVVWNPDLVGWGVWWADQFIPLS
jgi:hypothetical protein